MRYGTSSSASIGRRFEAKNLSVLVRGRAASVMVLSLALLSRRVGVCSTAMVLHRVSKSDELLALVAEFGFIMGVYYMVNDTPPANLKTKTEARRMVMSVTQAETVALLKVLSAARVGALEGLYGDMKQMAQRRGWLAGPG